MGMEYELKFRASEEILSAIRQDIAGQEVQYRMQTTYYDTPSRSLSDRKYTLRRRMENDRSVCTLKAPAGDISRGEWETECGDIEAAIPVLCKLGGPQDLADLTQEGIVPVCGAEFTRIAITLSYESSILELALDKGVLTGGDRQMPLCEVEVELKSGPAAAADHFAAQLAKTYGLQAEFRSKFRRALALGGQL